MEKKIIAVALVMIIMVVAFVGCGKDYKKTEIDGEEFYVVTDNRGNPIVDDKKGIAVAVTDENKEIQTDDNGEPQTRYYVQKHDIEAGEMVMGDNYDLLVLDGWFGDNGVVFKDKTDKQCYIKCSKLKELDKDETLDIYLEKLDEQNDQVIKGISDKEKMEELAKKNPQYEAFVGATATVEKAKRAAGERDYNIRENKIVNAKGEVIHYAENYYFVSNDVVYSVDYVCTNGVGYEENFDFYNYMKSGFKFYAKGQLSN